MKKLLTVLCMVGLTMLCSCGEGEVKEPKLEPEAVETIITENVIEETIITETVITEAIIEATTIVTTTTVEVPKGYVKMPNGAIVSEEFLKEMNYNSQKNEWF